MSFRRTLPLLLALALPPLRLGAQEIRSPSLGGFFDGGLPSLQAAPAVSVPLPPLPDDKGAHPDLRLPPSLVSAASGYSVARQLDKLRTRPAEARGTVRFAVLGDMEPGRFFWERDLWGRKGVGGRQLRAIQGRDVELTVQPGDFVFGVASLVR